MSVLHEEHFYILSEMGFQFRQDTGLTFDNWVSLLIGKVSAIRSDTIVPEGVIDKCMATLEFDIYFDHDFQLAVLNTLIFNTNLSS